ncbi:MAG: phosphorylase [Myxococcota bacterium]
MLVMAAVAEELGDLNGLTVGIGPVVAAATTAALLATHRPARVVLIGTCGAYPSNGTPGDASQTIGAAIVASRVGLGSGVAALGLGYVPRPPAAIACDPELVAMATVPAKAVLTCPAVTTDEELVNRLGDGWDVEHMEAFGVAWACRAAGVPFTAILGIANVVGPDAHVEWLTHREAAQEAARAAVRPLLAFG